MQSAKKNKKVRLKYFDFVRVNLTTQRELNTFDCCIWYTMFDSIDTELNTFDFCIEYTMFDPYLE